jgi:hypothetical protein
LDGVPSLVTENFPESDQPQQVTPGIEEFKPSLGISIVWNVLGTIMIFVGFFLFTYIYAQIGDGSGTTSFVESGADDENVFYLEFRVVEVLPLIVVTLLVLVAHEAIHGLAFRFFGGRPKFGAALIQKVLPVLYCTAPGYFFTRSQFSVIILAPLIVISVVGIALMPFVGNGLLIVIPLALNFAGAIGDVWMFGMLMWKRSDVQVEDLKDGLRFHYPDSTTA